MLVEEESVCIHSVSISKKEERRKKHTETHTQETHRDTQRHTDRHTHSQITKGDRKKEETQAQTVGSDKT
jgi:hypothetical protein